MSFSKYFSRFGTRAGCTSLARRRSKRVRRHLQFEMLEFRALLSGLTWTAFGESSVNQQAAGDTIAVGVSGRPESGTQSMGFHGATAEICPAREYRIAFDYNLSTWDSYNASGNPVGYASSSGGNSGGNPGASPVNRGGYWDSFSLSLTSVPYRSLNILQDPLQLHYVWGGQTWGDGSLETNTGTKTITVKFNTISKRFLNAVLDTTTQPTTDNRFPSWGSFKVTSINAVCGVEELSYSGAKHSDINKDDGTETYTAPHWFDQNLNGKATEKGDKQLVTAFVAGSTIRLAAKIKISDGANPSGKVMVKADGPGALDLPPTEATIAGTTLTLPATNLGSALEAKVDFYDPMTFTWSVSFDGGATYQSAGSTRNTVYVTLKDPISVSASPVFHTVIHLGSKNAKGETTDDGVVSKVWGDFSDRVVKRVKLQDGKVVDDLQMTYWKAPQPEDTCQSMELMLKSTNGDGACGAWSELLAKTIRNQGIIGADVYEIKANTTVNHAADGFLVKNWKFDRHITTGPNGTSNTTAAGDDFQAIAVGHAGIHGIHGDPAVTPGPNGILDTTPAGDDALKDGIFAGAPYPLLLYEGKWAGINAYGDKKGDAANVAGIPGQGNAEPPQFFFNHFVVKYSGKVYDPSYGAGPFADEISHENAAIDGIKSGERAKKNDTALKELTYSLTGI